MASRGPRADTTGAMDPLDPIAPYFLGPQLENETWARDSLDAVVSACFAWRRTKFPDDPPSLTADQLDGPVIGARRAQVDTHLAALLARLRDETPTHTPRYIGHMVSDVALPALLGHVAALLHNPNNTSREASKVGVALEGEAIGLLAQMMGFDPAAARGHFTSGGTVANLEAIWRARFRLDHRLALAVAGAGNGPLDVFAAAHMSQARFDRLLQSHAEDDAAMRACSSVLGNPYEAAERLSRLSGRPYRGPVILAPGHKHYSWVKAANLFGLGEEAFWPVALDREGRLCPRALAARIDEAQAVGRPILAVISVAGTTELGELDPIDAVADELDRRRTHGIDIWHHVDAAYGGFFCALGPEEPLLAPARRRALRAIRRAETITIDPHKAGYVPYACGALLTRDADCDRVSSFAAPYVERAELGGAPWTRTLEGSRAATGAAATWMMGRSVGFDPEGLGGVLRSTIESCRALRAALDAGIPTVRVLEPTDTNILCFSVAEHGDTLSAANARTAAVHRAIAASPNFSMSRTALDASTCGELIAAHVESYAGRPDADRLVLVRCVVLNPFWADRRLRERLLAELIGELRGIIQAVNAEGLAA